MSSESAGKKVGAPTTGTGLEAASERKYLKWYNKVGYGSGARRQRRLRAPGPPSS